MLEIIQAHLPEEPNSFIGRERELGELRRLAHSARALTLCGPGGIGKTRLALRLLALMAAEFPDGAWFVELADLREPELVISRVAAVLGVSEEPGRPLLETLADVLRPRRLVLALDNCEHLPGTCAEVARQLLATSPGLRLVITSREPLRMAAETVWRVPPLSAVSVAMRHDAGAGDHDEAIRLFADRAAAALPGFTLGPGNILAVAAVCRALDGLPLAIELAAAWVRVLSVDQICARLGNRFALLTTGDRSASPRQRTLRAAIEWSYALLTEAEQALFRRLSVFAGWSLEMAEQVCADDDIPAGDVLDLMAALVDKSLVLLEPEVLGQARYRMLDTIREYAAARLADAGESARFELALRDYVLRIAERCLAVGMAPGPVPWPERVACSRRYYVDEGNISQVLTWCLAHGDTGTGLRICIAVSPRWLVWGIFAEGGDWLDAFLEPGTPAPASRIRGAALVARAQLALVSDPAAAEALAGEGLALCRDAGEEFWVGTALNLLSEIALRTGQAETALAWADQALSAAQAAGDGWNEGYALGTRAAIAARMGKLREAAQLASASVAVMRRIDQQWGAARALLGLGDLARSGGHLGEAHDRYVEALPILEEVGARTEIARCLAGLGRVVLDLGAAGQARRHLTRSIKLSQATGTRIGVARGLEAFATLAMQEKQPERAVQLAAAAAALRESAGVPPLPPARTETYLAPARHLGEAAIARLWMQGRALSSEAAVALAMEAPSKAAADSDARALTVVAEPEATLSRRRSAAWARGLKTVMIDPRAWRRSPAIAWDATSLASHSTGRTAASSARYSRCSAGPVTRPTRKDRDAFSGTTTRSPRVIVFTKFHTWPVLFAIVFGEASGKAARSAPPPHDSAECAHAGVFCAGCQLARSASAVSTLPLVSLRARRPGRLVGELSGRVAWPCRMAGRLPPPLIQALFLCLVLAGIASPGTVWVVTVYPRRADHQDGRRDAGLSRGENEGQRPCSVLPAPPGRAPGAEPDGRRRTSGRGHLVTPAARPGPAPHRYPPVPGRRGSYRRSVARVQERDFPGALRAAARGDETAFAWLWRQAHPALLRYLQVVAGPGAEDVAAEVWLEIARGLARFRGGEPEFRGWLFTLARRRAADLRRYSGRHPEQLTRDDAELDQPAADDTAAAALENLSTRAALELIATLPQYQAEVIVLRVVAGLEVSQVAQITSRRPGSVRVAMHRGLRTLAARLAATAGRQRGVTR